MKDSLKTFSIAAITSIVVMTAFSFKPADPGNSTPQHIVYEYKQFSTIESVIPGGAW